MTNQLKIIAIIVALVLIGGGYYLYSLKNKISKSGEVIGITSQTSQTNQTENSTTTTININLNKTTNVIIKTNKGEIRLELLPNSAPNTVANFSKLASSGFYNGVKFHRVIKGFMIQGGDPLSKDNAMRARWGMGGPGYQFKDELTGQEKYPQGTLAMANSGPDTNGSQFFIVTANPGAPLPPNYTVFGKVINGMDVALQIENVKTSPNDQPIEDVVIEKIMVK